MAESHAEKAGGVAVPEPSPMRTSHRDSSLRIPRLRAGLLLVTSTTASAWSSGRWFLCCPLPGGSHADLPTCSTTLPMPHLWRPPNEAQTPGRLRAWTTMPQLSPGQYSSDRQMGRLETVAAPHVYLRRLSLPAPALLALVPPQPRLSGRRRPAAVCLTRR